VVVKYLVGGKCSDNSVQSIVHSALCSQARFTTATGHPTILLLTDPLHWCCLYLGRLLGDSCCWWLHWQVPFWVTLSAAIA